MQPECHRGGSAFRGGSDARRVANGNLTAFRVGAVVGPSPYAVGTYAVFSDGGHRDPGRLYFESPGHKPAALNTLVRCLSRDVRLERAGRYIPRGAGLPRTARG